MLNAVKKYQKGKVNLSKRANVQWQYWCVSSVGQCDEVTTSVLLGLELGKLLLCRIVCQWQGKASQAAVLQ